ncbi:hypothetical protein NED98_13210 [Sphingomonas sp. MMSM20]|uniref:hypothetical protein n=1 Tax=Sphingomonas lycopersici TaxID=2951807 RepID=UPI0022374E08|nr:hypothetical protein [Sphingomonas lycopersici]MCW6531205.1 hypothetical protein [Sphingomonas lycopersici]
MEIGRRRFIGVAGAAVTQALESGRQTTSALLRRRETISVTGRGASVGGLRAAMREVAGYGGGTVRLQTGPIAVDTNDLIANGSIKLPGNVVLEGEGALFTYAGNRIAPPLFTAQDVSRVTLRNLVAAGNGQAIADTRSGSFALFSLSGGAKADMEDIRLENLRLSGFGAERWLQFLQRNASGKRMLGLRVIDFDASAGRALAPEAIGIAASPLWIYGAEGEICDVAVRGLSVQASGLKQGVVLFHKVRQALIDSALVVDAGKTGARDDAGAYAVMIYADPGEMSDITIISTNIQRPRSAGIYLRGAQRVHVVGASITGQRDAVTTNLPKGAIVLNGCSGVTIEGARLSGNRFDLSVADGGVNALNLEVRDMRTSGSDTSVILAVSPGKGTIGHARFINCQLAARDRVLRVMNEQVPGRYYNDVQIVGGVLYSDTAANVIEFNQQTPTGASGYRIEGTTIRANNVAIMTAGLQGLLTIRRIAIEGLGRLSCGIVADDCAALDWDGIIFRNLGSGCGYTARSIRRPARGTLRNLHLGGAANPFTSGSLQVTR